MVSSTTAAQAVTSPSPAATYAPRSMPYLPENQLPATKEPVSAAASSGSGERERPGALLARRTRTIKQCSSDARSRGQPWPLPLREVSELGRTIDNRARPTRAIEDQLGWGINQTIDIKERTQPNSFLASPARRASLADELQQRQLSLRPRVALGGSSLVPFSRHRIVLRPAPPVGK